MLQTSKDPLAFHIREDIRTVDIEQPIPYFLSIPRSFRKGYKLVLKLAARIAAKHSSQNWTGVTFLFGNAVQVNVSTAYYFDTIVDIYLASV